MHYPELEVRRRPAVRRVGEGWEQKDVAAFLGVTGRAVRGWVAAQRKAGDDGLAAEPHPGPAPRLSRRREQAVLSWPAESPPAFGYETDPWTTKRLTEVIERRYGIRFNSNYLAEWLTRRGFSPQKPEIRAVERGEPAIARWVAEDRPRVEKGPGRRGPRRPDRRERLLPQTDGPPDLGPEWPLAGADRIRPAAGEGLDDRRHQRGPGTEAARAVLEDRPEALHRRRGGGEIPAGPAAAPRGQGGRHLGRGGATTRARRSGRSSNDLPA